MTDQGILVRDCVLPIVEVRGSPDRQTCYERLLGTGFVVRPGSHLLTAKHVLRGAKHPVALSVEHDSWRLVELGRRYDHPVEDVSIVELSTQFLHSFIGISVRAHHSGGTYHLFGYPEDIIYDRGIHEMNGKNEPLPDLIYSSGHIRRRVNWEIPPLLGRSFYEISNVAGSGCSGSPLICRTGSTWEAAGLYDGERTTQIGLGSVRELAYAVRFEAIHEWLQASGCKTSD